MAITIRKITDEQIETAKRLTDKGTAAASVVACIAVADKSTRLVESQSETIQELRDRVRHLEMIQGRLANVCDEALTIVRQRELL